MQRAMQDVIKGAMQAGRGGAAGGAAAPPAGEGPGNQGEDSTPGETAPEEPNEVHNMFRDMTHAQLNPRKEA